MDAVGRLVPVADDAPERVKRQGACFDSPKRLAVFVGIYLIRHSVDF